LGRRHETSAPGPGRASRYEFEYERGGTLAYLAAWDVHHANLFDRVEPSTGIEHASWLNQIELYFSIVQRKALTPNDLATLDALAERLLGFGEHYRQVARPFQWTFTRQDLNNLIARIDRHEPQLALAA
ncbi:MAG TPA: hypothetical protein VGL78_18870, partial [Solirubrobacteraceae bacterium]